MFKKIFVFCDASIAIKDKIALGAFLILDESFEKNSFAFFSTQEKSLQDKIQYIRFETHKSTLAEIKTFLHIMKKLKPLENKKVLFFTDCQTLTDLYGERRQKLLDRDFKKTNGTPLPHGETYRELINFFQNYDIRLQKVKGHKPKKEKDNKIDQLFSLVDSASRKKLRTAVKNLENSD